MAQNRSYVSWQVVIPMDPTSEEDVAFWRSHNPDILAMAASAKVNLSPDVLEIR